ncbi:MAG: Phosphocholine transferase AnkX [Candidatus Anoxychlamydiales bacterium]|nr:Phosphocholine transferase AnkX [Candidatus Anoxychlamydiales bacterium]
MATNIVSSNPSTPTTNYQAVTKKEEERAFLIAIESGNTEEVQRFLDKGVDVDIRDFPSNNTPLMCAVSKGHIEIVSMLIERGADIHAQDDRGYAALFNVNWRRDKDLIEILLKKGACFKPHGQQDGEELLLVAKAGLTEIFRGLLRRGVDINYYDSNNNTALWFAAKEGNKEIVEIILKKAEDLNLVDCRRALILAAEAGLKDIVRFLLDKEEINVDYRDMKDNTALMLAAKNGHKDIVKMLLTRASNYEIERALMQLTITKDHIEIVDLLCRKLGIEITYDISKIEGIANYANKLIKQLAQQTEEEQGKSDNTVLVFFPLKDDNCAFPIMSRVEKARSLRQIFSVVKIKHPTTPEMMKEILQKKQWNTLIINVHGHITGRGMYFSEDFKLTRHNVPEVFKTLKDHSKQQEIILASCLTGVKGGIAEVVAETSRIKTIAPTLGSNNFYFIKTDNRFEIRFTHDDELVDTKTIDPLTESNV